MKHGDRKYSFSQNAHTDITKTTNPWITSTQHNNQSPTFKTIRSSSLQLKPTHEGNNILMTQSRKRKHRIFQENKSIIHKQITTQQKRLTQASKGIQNRAQQGVIINFKQPKYANDQTNIKSPLQFKELIQKKLAQRSSIGTSQKVRQKMAMKQREIRFLKLQIQRFRRCEILNKENEEMYRRLITKLKTNKQQQNSVDGMSQEPSQVRTPINSLTEIRFTFAPPQGKQLKQEQTSIKNNQNLSKNTEALKTIPENQENQYQGQSKNEILVTIKSKDLDTVQKSKEYRTNRSPQIPNIDRQKDPIYRAIKQQVVNHSRAFNKDNYQAPLNVRLHEINRTLESNINRPSRRPMSTPHKSQSAQKSKRGDHSLYKTHIYAMMA